MGPSILRYGTPEQKLKFLPGIIAGDIVFCIGMSEPGAGSDLAGLQTKAVDDGDAYILNGQKIWTSFAHLADYCYLVARTNPDVPKHRRSASVSPSASDIARNVRLNSSGGCAVYRSATTFCLSVRRLSVARPKSFTSL